MAKRQRDMEPEFRHGRNKRRSSGGEREPQGLPSPDDTVYRILCPVDRIGSLIGKEGSIIKSLRLQTRAKIKVTESIPGVDERIALIWSSPKDSYGAGERKEKQRDSRGYNDADDDDFEGLNDRNELDGGPEDANSGFLCPAQHALFKVHARITENDGGGGGEGENNERDSSPHQQQHQVTARLLVPNNQIGCLLGKGGKIIEKMRIETAAQIRILPKDLLPHCALPSDELVQISGDPAVVRKALYEISARIHENPPRDRPQSTPPILPPPGLLPPGLPMLHQMPDIFSSGSFLPPGNFGIGAMGGPLLGMPPPLSGLGTFGGLDATHPWPLASPAGPVLPLPGARAELKDPTTGQEFSIRLLCPDEKMGPIIGKGGNAIRQLREMTGVRIKVDEIVADCDERVIILSATEYLDNPVSPVIEAALQLQNKTCDINQEKGGLITTRLLVSSKHIGCLLGRKGSVITEMRKKTTASIKVLKKEEIPKCAEDSDELVQIIGDERIAREALIEVLSRLRNNIFKDQVAMRSKSAGPSLQPLPAFPLQGDNRGKPADFLGRHEVGSPGRAFSLNGFGLPGGGMFPTSGSIFPPSHAGREPLEVHSPFVMPSFFNGPRGGYEKLGGTGRVVGDSLGQLRDGLLKENPDETVTIAIPGYAVSSVLDEEGINISRIRQISGANLKIRDTRAGSRDKIVEISGNPDQTEAAQSLLRGFIISGRPR